ncbi:hypothetical protein F5Y05DRAFT_378039 [Hypoxylon sp. FL0543]|nr:hypothetical protein F5Y05DRAFT_378039 [Hypoxylon sp. FL0543]
MLRAQLKRISLVPRPRGLTGAGPSRRGFSSNLWGEELPPVPVLRPTLWALAATATIFIGCATYDVRRDVQAVKRGGLFKDDAINSYEDLEEATKHRGNSRDITHRPQESSKWFPSAQIEAALADYTEAEKLTLGAAALNIGLVGASSLAPGTFKQYLSHVPVSSPNYTLLTAAFGHSGLMHAGCNTFVMLQFAPPLSNSHVFQGNGSHLAAFYLSTAILSSLGHHLATMLPTRTYRMNRFLPGMGASGAVSAMLGSYATLHPDGKIGIIFIPGTYPVRDVMAALVLFELGGLFIGYPTISLAHAAHLAGLALGSAYVYFDGKKHIWRPTRRSVFYWMKRLNMV